MLATGRVRGCSVVEALRTGGRGVKNQALVRSLRSQSRLVETTTDGFEVWDTPIGRYHVPRGTDLFFVLAEQARDLYGSGGDGVARGDVVLDGGANVGVFVKEALDRGARQVVAIEPVPRNVTALQRNFAPEIATGRVVVVPKGVWNKTDVLRMYTYDNSALDSFVLSERPESQTAARPVDLPLTTIDAIVGDLRLERVDFIKLDIEGAERKALEGAKATLTRFRPRLAVATENLPDDFEAIPAIVDGFDLRYEHSFGDCELMPQGIIRPETVFFKPRR